jgi:L-alanine-DL-glutamate epimerase-like enolase superfamily enzyme
MKITRVEPIHLRLPNVNERCDGSQETLVVKVYTDENIVGVGEADSSSLVAKAIIEAPLSHKICRGLAECVLGQDPFEIDRLIHRMYEGSIFFGRQGAVIQAMSGIEIALWDIVGKATGRPVYQVSGLCLHPLWRYSRGNGTDWSRAGGPGLPGRQVRVGAHGPE